eukprot:2382758-Rhodomonas_salina.1
MVSEPIGRKPLSEFDSKVECPELDFGFDAVRVVHRHNRSIHPILVLHRVVLHVPGHHSLSLQTLHLPHLVPTYAITQYWERWEPVLGINRHPISVLEILQAPTGFVPAVSGTRAVQPDPSGGHRPFSARPNPKTRSVNTDFRIQRSNEPSHKAHVGTGHCIANVEHGRRMTP